MENGSKKVGLRMAAGILVAITIIVAVFASGVTFPSLENNPSLGSEQGRLTVLLMDAPVDVDELWITISSVAVHKVGNEEVETSVEESESTVEDDDKGWITLDLSGVDEEDLTFDLLSYQINDDEDDKVLNLADDVIAEGTYNKIRLNVTEAEARYYQYTEGGELMTDETTGDPKYEAQPLKVPPNRIDVITKFTIDSAYPVVVLIDMQPDWVAISHSGNLRPVMKATVSQLPPADAQIETIETPGE